jgi:hypothetical protein
MRRSVTARGRPRRERLHVIECSSFTNLVVDGTGDADIGHAHAGL